MTEYVTEAHEQETQPMYGEIFELIAIDQGAFREHVQAVLSAQHDQKPAQMLEAWSRYVDKDALNLLYVQSLYYAGPEAVEALRTAMLELDVSE